MTIPESVFCTEAGTLPDDSRGQKVMRKTLKAATSRWTYTSLTALGEDIVFARVLAGLHFQFSMDAGRALGLAVNAHVIENNFRPTDGDD